MPTSSLTTTAPGGTATFPKPVGVGATTVTVNGSPATLLASTLDTVTLTASPAKGATVVVSLTVTDAAPKETPAYNATNGTLNVTSEQRKWFDTFTDLSKWDVVAGANTTVAAGGGAITISDATGSANKVTTLTTKDTFSVPFRAFIGFSVAQRLDGQKIYLEAISVDPLTLQPDGLNTIAWMFQGLDANLAGFSLKNAGTPEDEVDGYDAASTGSGGAYELDVRPGETWLRSGALETGGDTTFSYRFRTRSPDPNAVYKLRVRMVNTGVAPGQANSASVNYISVQDATSLVAEVTASRALSVTVANTPNVAVTGPVTISGVVSTASSNPFAHARTALGSANAVSVKSTAANLLALAVSNMGTQTVYLKLFNKAGAPNPGVDVPVLTIPLAPGEFRTHDVGVSGLRFTAGLGYCITAGAADTDAAILTTAPFPKVVMSYN